MGIAKRLWMERQEDECWEEKAEWIRESLDDEEADESTVGWDELSDEYDALQEYESYDEEDYDDWSVAGKSRKEIFDEVINATIEILAVPVEGSSFKNLLVMLHAHVVAGIEAYLSSTFIENTLSKESYMRRLVENDPEFAKRKFTIKEFFTKQEEMKDDLNKYLKNVIFHDIAKIKPMYKAVLNIDFGEISWLFKAVILRHHCVHRAGYDKEGNEIQLCKENIEDLINEAEELVHNIESKLTETPNEADLIWDNMASVLT